MTKKEKRYIKEAIIGIMGMILGMLSGVILDGDITACVLIWIIALPYVCANIYSFYYYHVKRRRRRMSSREVVM